MEQDLHRIYTLKKYGIMPFVQPYRDFENKRQPTQYEKDLARWANRAWLFKSMPFEDYEPRKGFKCWRYIARERDEKAIRVLSEQKNLLFSDI